MKENLKPIFKLSELEEERKRNTIESKYIKLGKGEFVEKRDNQFYYIKFDKDGNFHEEKCYSSLDNNLKHEVKARDLMAFQNGVIVLETTSELKIATDRELNKVLIIHHRGKYMDELKHLNSTNDIKVDMILDLLQEKTKFDDYNKIQNDAEDPYKVKGVFYSTDVDSRSRKIDFGTYIKELKSVLGVVPVDKQNEFVEENIEKLLNKVYGTSQLKNEDIYLSIKNGVKLALNEKDEKTYIKKISMLEKYTDELNDIRKARVEEDKKSSIIGFFTPEARTVYELNLKRQQMKNLMLEEKDFIKNSDKYIIDRKPFKEELSFPGVYYLGAFNCCSKNNIDINELTSDIKQFLEKYPEGEREEKFNKFSTAFLGSFYGKEELTDRNKENNSLRHGIYNEMKDIMRKSIFDNTEIENDRFYELQGKAQELAKKEYDWAEKRSMVGFKDDETRESYLKAKEINERDDIPEDAKKIVVDSLIESNKIRLQSKKMIEEAKKLAQCCKNSDVKKQLDIIEVGIRSKTEKKEETKEFEIE